MIDLDAIQRAAEEATPGPWGWRGYSDASIELRALHSGMPTVLTAMRSLPCVVELADGSIALTADACDDCRAEYAKTADPFVDYRCPKAENLNTVWLRDPESHILNPANRWAVDEVTYRRDVASVDQPDAAHIAAADPSTVLALVAAVRAAREILDAAEAAEAGAVWSDPIVKRLGPVLAPFGGDGQP